MLLAAAFITCMPHQPRTAAGALAIERYWVAAIERRDAAALDCLLAPDFTDINWQGKVLTRAQMLDGFDAKPRVTLVLDELTTDLSGDLAVVRGRNAETDAAASRSARCGSPMCSSIATAPGGHCARRKP